MYENIFKSTELEKAYQNKARNKVYIYVRCMPKRFQEETFIAYSYVSSHTCEAF